MKTSTKKLLCLLLALAVIFALAACDRENAGTAEETTQNEEPAAEQYTSAEPEPEQAKKNGDIVILFTSDVHCAVDQGFGYAGLEQVRDCLVSQGAEVILVDDGDSIQGEPIGTMTKGEAVVDLMNEMGYSVAIPGNHEFDYGVEQFLSLAERAEYTYISCNFNCMGETVFEPWVIRELAGKRVAFVGVTTPKTLTSTTPSYFKDENGEFIYGFMQGETGEALYNAVQSAVDDARNEGADYVIILGHLGNEEACAPYTYGDVISNTTGVDVLLDGHSHDADQVTVKNKEGEDVLRSACGTKMAAIGWCKITADGEISTGLYTWDNEVSAPELLGIDNHMSKAVAEANDALDEKLDEAVAVSQVELTINDPAAVDSSGRPIRMVRRAETNLGDFCADAMLAQSGADAAVMNGGGIRDNISAGEVTLRDILNIHPYGNSLCVLEVTGQQILDALEWGSRAVPGEVGGFLQAAGISYEIHSYIESPCIADENDMFIGIQGERRVKNARINGEPIDPDAVYALAGTDHTLLNNGGGYTMFDGATVLQDRVKLDNQLVIDYITESLNGVIGEEYENPYGQGRIVIVEEAD